MTKNDDKINKLENDLTRLDNSVEGEIVRMPESEYHMILKDGVLRGINELFENDFENTRKDLNLVTAFMGSLNEPFEKMHYGNVEEINIYVPTKVQSKRTLEDLSILSTEKLFEAVSYKGHTFIKLFNPDNTVTNPIYGESKTASWKFSEGRPYYFQTSDGNIYMKAGTPSDRDMPEIGAIIGLTDALSGVKSALFDEQGYDPKYAIIEMKNGRRKAYAVDLTAHKAYSVERA